MAQLQFNTFEDATRPSMDRELIPVGDYFAKIIDSDLKTNKAGTGQYIEFVWDINGPSHRGRRVWQRVNIHNANAEAADIGKRELNSICKACGKAQIMDTSELHGVECKVKIKIRKGNNGYSDSNEIAYVNPAKQSNKADILRQAQAPQGYEAPASGEMNTSNENSKPSNDMDDEIPF